MATKKRQQKNSSMAIILGLGVFVLVLWISMETYYLIKKSRQDVNATAVATPIKNDIGAETLNELNERKRQTIPMKYNEFKKKDATRNTTQSAPSSSGNTSSATEQTSGTNSSTPTSTTEGSSSSANNTPTTF